MGGGSWDQTQRRSGLSISGSVCYNRGLYLDYRLLLSASYVIARRGSFSLTPSLGVVDQRGGQQVASEECGGVTRERRSLP